MPKAKSSVEIKNRRASFDYEFLETFQAGIVLTGTEIKSIRAGKASLVDAFCYFNNNELYVKNMHVADYWWGTWGKHDPRRDRTLLLTRKELSKLQRSVKEKGLFFEIFFGFRFFFDKSQFLFFGKEIISSINRLISDSDFRNIA